MRLINRKRMNRSAEVIAERDGIVLYNSCENGKVFYPNMARSAERFYEEY